MEVWKIKIAILPPIQEKNMREISAIAEGSTNFRGCYVLDIFSISSRERSSSNSAKNEKIKVDSKVHFSTDPHESVCLEGFILPSPSSARNHNP